MAAKRLAEDTVRGLNQIGGVDVKLGPQGYSGTVTAMMTAVDFPGCCILLVFVACKARDLASASFMEHLAVVINSLQPSCTDPARGLVRVLVVPYKIPKHTSYWTDRDGYVLVGRLSGREQLHDVLMQRLRCLRIAETAIDKPQKPDENRLLADAREGSVPVDVCDLYERSLRCAEAAVDTYLECVRLADEIRASEVKRFHWLRKFFPGFRRSSRQMFMNCLVTMALLGGKLLCSEGPRLYIDMGDKKERWREITDAYFWLGNLLSCSRTK